MSLKTLRNFVAPQNLLPISPNIKTRHKTKIPFPVLQCDLLYGRPHSQLSNIWERITRKIFVQLVMESIRIANILFYASIFVLRTRGIFGKPSNGLCFRLSGSRFVATGTLRLLRAFIC